MMDKCNASYESLEWYSMIRDQQERRVKGKACWELHCLCVGFMNENEPGIIHIYMVECSVFSVHYSRLCHLIG